MTLRYYVYTYATDQSHSCEANRFSAIQGIPRILWNPKFPYRIHKCLPSVPILSQINVPHPTSWRYILILYSHQRLGFLSSLLPSDFPTEILYTPLLSSISATSLAHVIISEFITHKIFGEEYRSWSSSLCCFLPSPLPHSL